MKRLLIATAACTALAGLAGAQEIKNPADAFRAGQDFSNGAKGKGAATGTVNAASGAANVPKYSTDPPETGLFDGGKNLIGGAGNSKIDDCKSYAAGNAYDQQECDAVNYLNARDRTNKFTIDKKTDPLMVNSKGTIASPGTIPASGTTACRIEKKTIPGTYTTETCEESRVLASFACNKTLLPQCGFVGSAIKEHKETKTGAFVHATLFGTSTAGLYDYNIEVPYRNCGGEGVGEINFDLDTIGYGSYITVNLSNLDDAAAIGVNNTTVFAGYPNAGPVHDGAFFPGGRKEFQIGYSWDEEVSTSRCVAFNGDGNCVRADTTTTVKTFFANTKLLDSCPAGYSPVRQSANQYCDPNSGDCTPVDSYTPNNMVGFFCNAEGRFLMNRHEGGGTWGGSVSASMPLQIGMNAIKVYWGTGQGGKDCGNVKVSGQIYNVAPACTARWDDQCASARSALAK